MGAPTLAGLAAAISIAMRRIEVRELAFGLFNGDQRPVTVLRPAVTEKAEGRMRGNVEEAGEAYRTVRAETGIRPRHRCAKPN